MNIQLKNIQCFGYTHPKKDSWFILLHDVSSKGWKSIDINKFQKNLCDNINSSYLNMISIQFVNLDDDQEYIAAFNNGLKKWVLEIPDSPADAVLPETKTEFFKSEEFKNTCKRADEIFTLALKSYQNYVKPEIEVGKFLDLDEAKAEACEHMLSDTIFRKNLKLGKFVK